MLHSIPLNVTRWTFKIFINFQKYTEVCGQRYFLVVLLGLNCITTFLYVNSRSHKNKICELSIWQHHNTLVQMYENTGICEKFTKMCIYCGTTPNQTEGCCCTNMN